MPRSSLEKFLVRTAFEQMAVHDALLDLLSPRDLGALSGVSFLVREDVERYKRRRWNVDDFLHPWFRHSSPEFRPHLAKAGAIVTGSQVLRFFNREPPDPTCDLDIITRVGGLMTLAMFLSNLGYVRLRRFKMPRSHEDYPLISSIFSLTSSHGFVNRTSKAGIIEIFDFYNRFDAPDSEFGRTVKVQVIVVFQYPVEHILFGFHSSESKAPQVRAPTNRLKPVF